MVNVLKKIPLILTIIALCLTFIGIILIRNAWLGLLDKLTNIIIVQSINIIDINYAFFCFSLLLGILGNFGINGGLFVTICGIVLLVVSITFLLKFAENFPHMLIWISFCIVITGFIITWFASIGLISSFMHIMFAYLYISIFFGYSLLLGLLGPMGINEGLIVIISGVGILVFLIIYNIYLKRGIEKEGVKRLIGFIRGKEIKKKSRWIVLTIAIGLALIVLFYKYIEIWFKYPGILSAKIFDIYGLDPVIKMAFVIFDKHFCWTLVGLTNPFVLTMFSVDILNGPPFIYIIGDPLINWLNFSIVITIGLICFFSLWYLELSKK